MAVNLWNTQKTTLLNNFIQWSKSDWIFVGAIPINPKVLIELQKLQEDQWAFNNGHNKFAVVIIKLSSKIERKST